MIAIRNAHAFRPNSIIAKKRMPMSLVGAMTRTMSASWQNYVNHLFLHLLLLELFGLVLLGLPFFGCSRTTVLERFLTNGHGDRKVPGQTCRSQPEITVLEFQDSPGLAHVVILR